MVKKFAIFSLLIILIFNYSYASNIGNYFRGATAQQLSPEDMKSTIVGVLSFVGFGLATIVLMFTGIQFLMANGQKKAQLKDKLWLIVIGVFVLAAGIPLYNLFFNIIHNAFWGN